MVAFNPNEIVQCPSWYFNEYWINNEYWICDRCGFKFNVISRLEY